MDKSTKRHNYLSAKSTNQNKPRSSIKVVSTSHARPFGNEKPIWTFNNLDHDGKFKFDIRRNDFDCVDFLDKMIAYSNMTWLEISRQTHDAGKSKHHFLSPDSLSNFALERIKVKNLEDKMDSIFSFALNNKVRVIGIRSENSAEFQVIWYDSDHSFAPSTR